MESLETNVQYKREYAILRGFQKTKNPRAVVAAEGMAHQRSVMENADMQYESTLRNPRSQDLTGHSFGRLTVLAFAGYRKHRRYWTCQCLCGTIKAFGQSDILYGDSRSCGCLHKEL